MNHQQAQRGVGSGRVDEQSLSALRDEVAIGRGPATIPAKRTYARPSLQRHGRLADLTQFGGSQMIDSGGNFGNLTP